MKVSLTMPDELFEQYVVKFGLPAAYGRMRQAIELLRNVDKSDRVIIVCSDERRAIEHVFQTTVDDSAKLVKLIQNMNTVKLGDVSMEFSQAQLERLAMQASFHGRTTETYIRETVEELKQTMLERV